MKSKLFVSAYLFILLTTTASPASASTVLVLDTAAKSSAYLPQQIVEAKDLLAHLEDGERVAVVRAAPTRTVFDNVLGPEERVALGSALATVYAGKGGSDLGAALAVAASLAARGPGPKRIIIFTPGISQPPERSAFYGKTLEELVADSGLVPDDTALMVRVYGTAPLASTRANVRLLRETPQWHSEPAFARASPTPAEPPTAESQQRLVTSRFGVWVVSGAATLVAFVALGLWVWIRRRASGAARRSEDEERRMLSAVVMEPDGDGSPSEKLIFNLDTGVGEFCLCEGDALTAGDRWDADPFFPAAGACARFVVRSGALSVENVGTGAVAVGTLPLPVGGSRRLPAKYLEVSVGGKVITVMPESAPAGATPGSAGGEVLHARGEVM
jgi:hypothetical protein